VTTNRLGLRDLDLRHLDMRHLNLRGLDLRRLDIRRLEPGGLDIRSLDLRSLDIRGWGSTAAERAASYPCDDHIGEEAASCFRAVDVDAPPDVTFRWLCQLRVAPYSYDLLDNFGRKSPQELKEGLDKLEIGQRFMTVFELVDFEPAKQITLLLVSASAVFGNVAVTYAVKPRARRRSRIVVKLRWELPLARSRLGRFLPVESVALLGDLVMMRKQLLNLKRLAETKTV
jgi:hypothetical protein